MKTSGARVSRNQEIETRRLAVGLPHRPERVHIATGAASLAVCRRNTIIGDKCQAFALCDSAAVGTINDHHDWFSKLIALEEHHGVG